MQVKNKAAQQHLQGEIQSEDKGEKPMKKKVTLSLDERIFRKFRNNFNGSLSSYVDTWMLEMIEKTK